MKKLMMVLCLSAGCCGAMHPIQEDTPATRGQSNTTTGQNYPQNLNVTGILEKEGLCWFRMERILQPLEVVVNATGVALSTVAAIFAESRPKLSKDLVISTAIVSATSGILSVFLMKMANRVNDIDQQLGLANNHTNNGIENTSRELETL